MRNSKWHPKGDTQDDTQDVTQGVTQEDTLDEKIEKAIKDNLNVTTEELAKQFGVTSMTIKRHLAKMPHIRYVGSGYSGHWEVLDKEYKPPSRFVTVVPTICDNQENATSKKWDVVSHFLSVLYTIRLAIQPLTEQLQ